MLTLGKNCVRHSRRFARVIEKVKRCEGDIFGILAQHGKGFRADSLRGAPFGRANSKFRARVEPEPANALPQTTMADTRRYTRGRIAAPTTRELESETEGSRPQPPASFRARSPDCRSPCWTSRTLACDEPSRYRREICD